MVRPFGSKLSSTATESIFDVILAEPAMGLGAVTGEFLKMQSA